MLTVPNPTRLTHLLEAEVVGHHRNLYCPEYDECLEVAAGGGWRSWTCERCALGAPPTSARTLLHLAVARSGAGVGVHLPATTS